MSYDPWPDYLEFVELDYAGRCAWLERNINELRKQVMEHPDVSTAAREAMTDLGTSAAAIGALAMDEHIDRLEAIAHEHGYEYTVELSIATESAWGASVRLSQLADGKLTGRSIVFEAGGGQYPADLLREVVEDVLAWVATGTRL